MCKHCVNKTFANVVVYYLVSYRQVLHRPGCLRPIAYSDLELLTLFFPLPEYWDLQIYMLNIWAQQMAILPELVLSSPKQDFAHPCQDQ